MAAISVRAEDVILTVNVAESLNNYYKFKNFVVEMSETEERAQAKVAVLEGEGQAMVADFRELEEQAKSDILSEEARKEALLDAQKKYQEIQVKEQEVRKFLTDTQRQFADRRNKQLSLFYQDIAEVVNEISKERSATLVIDVSVRVGDGRAPVLYTDGSYDITPEVVERINATEGQEEEAEPAPAE